jgi:hypothetical protein
MAGTRASAHQPGRGEISWRGRSCSAESAARDGATPDQWQQCCRQATSAQRRIREEQLEVRKSSRWLARTRDMDEQA